MSRKPSAPPTRAPALVEMLDDQRQRRPLKLPKGDLRLGDGRVLRPIIGYDLSKLQMNEVTRQSILASAGWHEASSDLVVTAGIEDTARWGPLLHVSMSHPDRDPAWATIKLVKDAFFPRDMDAAMMLPREQDFINLHEHCFHLWQIPEHWGLQ